MMGEYWHGLAPAAPKFPYEERKKDFYCNWHPSRCMKQIVWDVNGAEASVGNAANVTADGPACPVWYPEWGTFQFRQWRRCRQWRAHNAKPKLFALHAPTLRSPRSRCPNRSAPSPGGAGPRPVAMPNCSHRAGRGRTTLCSASAARRSANACSTRPDCNAVQPAPSGRMASASPSAASCAALSASLLYCAVTALHFDNRARRLSRRETCPI